MTDTVIDFARPLADAPSFTPWVLAADGAAAPVTAGHYCRLEAAQGYAAGQLTLAAFDATLAPLGGHYMVVLLTGEITLTGADGTVTLLRTGDAAVLPLGLAGQWRNAKGTRLNFMTLAGEAGGTPSPRRLDPAVALSASPGPNAAFLESEMPSCANNMAFEDSTGQLEVGIWAATPYTRRLNTYTHDELMYLLEGSVRISDGEGRHFDFTAGDCFLVRAGQAWAWRSTVPVKKIFSTFDPA